MNHLLTIFSFLLTINSFAQGADTTDKQQDKFPRKVSFVTKVDIRQATKDGIYLNGYVVNMEYEKARSLDGKTVRIRGKVKIIKGIGEYTSGEAGQGRKGDTKYIRSPSIEIVSD